MTRTQLSQSVEKSRGCASALAGSAGSITRVRNVVLKVSAVLPSRWVSFSGFTLHVVAPETLGHTLPS